MIKLIITSLFAWLCLGGYCQNASRLDTAKYYDFVELMPTYKGDINNKQLAPDVMSKVRRTCELTADSSKVLIHFIVETDGSVQKAVVIRGGCPDINEKASAALKELKFTPGKQSGQAVRVKEVLMLRFPI
jgi:Gram-negative bacterial TonB protein C-terminal